MADNPFNPFLEIAESKKRPHARTLRTSLSQKLWDAFNTINGRPPVLSDKPHIGLFDIGTLFIPALFLGMLSWSLDATDKSPLAFFAVIPLVIINIPLVAARFVVSAIATIVTSPITGLVHLFSSLMAKKTKKQAIDLVGDMKNGEQCSLKDYLAAAHMDLEELNITLKKEANPHGLIQEEYDENAQHCPSKPPRLPAAKNYRLMFWRKATGPSSALECEGCLNGGCDQTHAPFSVAIQKDAMYSPGVTALFKLNIGDVVTNMENDSDLNSKFCDDILLQNSPR